MRAEAGVGSLELASEALHLDAGAAHLATDGLLADVDVLAHGDLAGDDSRLLDDRLLVALNELDGLGVERRVGLVSRERLVDRRAVHHNLLVAEAERLLLHVGVDVLVDAHAAADDLALADLEVLFDLLETLLGLLGVASAVLGHLVRRVGVRSVVIVSEVLSAAVLVADRVVARHDVYGRVDVGVVDAGDDERAAAADAFGVELGLVALNAVGVQHRRVGLVRVEIVARGGAVGA